MNYKLPLGFLVAVAIFLFIVKLPEDIERSQQLSATANSTLPINTVSNLRFLDGKTGSIPLATHTSNGTSTGAQFLKEYGKKFGISNILTDIKLSRIKKDELGMQHLSFKQYYNNIPVYGGQLLVHLGSDLSVKSANGNIVGDIKLSTVPKITKETARILVETIARKSFSFINPKANTPTLYIFNKHSFNRKEENKNYLVWEVVVKDSTAFQRELLYINAETGDLVYHLSGSNSEIARRTYNCYSSGCTGIIDSMLGVTIRNEGDTLTGISEVDNLHGYILASHNYFKQNFGLNGANKIGGIGDGSFDHPATSTDSYAFFRPTTRCPNSFWDGSRVFFCNKTVNPALVGHEYMHAVTEFNGPEVPMPYEGESGAINEALSDIFGQAIEKTITGRSSWKIGPSDSTWRDFHDPVTLNHPDTFYSSKLYCGTGDYGGVHVNSNIITHAAYLMVNGGNFNSCQISPVDQTKVSKIFYRTLTNYLTTTSSFNDLFTGVNRACIDLYGKDSTVCASVLSALQATELDQPGGCSTIPEVAPACAVLSRSSPETSTSTLQVKKIIPVSLENKLLAPKVTIPVIPKNPQNLSTKAEFTFRVTRNDYDAKIEGDINNFGKAPGCTNPRSFDPITFNWGDGFQDKPAVATERFTATHIYRRPANEYRAAVTIVNSCLGNKTIYE